MSITRIANYLLIGILLMFIISTCLTVNETTDLPTIEVPVSSPAPIPSPGISAMTLVADPGYTEECQKINPSSMQGQISYHGIIPGKTTLDEVIALLGFPNEEGFQSFASWDYKGFSISLEGEIVDSIQIYDDKDLFVNLRRIILQYGCPNLIFAVDMNEEPKGFYSITEFIYLDLGIVFNFGAFPVSLDETPELIDIFRSQSLINYLRYSNIINFGPEIGKPVLWSEAVR